MMRTNVVKAIFILAIKSSDFLAPGARSQNF